MSEWTNPVINIADAPAEGELEDGHWGCTYKVLTPTMRDRGGKLGLVQNIVPPGRTACPFHTHQLEDEVFFVQSGRGVLRYGDRLIELKAGDCVSCPAGVDIAHQIANPFSEDLVYLALGNYEPREVCTYPDTNKVMVRSLKTVGRLQKTDYNDGEPDRPKIFDLADEANMK